MLEKYLTTTHGKTHCMYKMKLIDIFKVRKGSEEKRFKDVGNRMLLWHGSRLTNWAGILSQGLRIAPPEAPCTGYMVRGTFRRLSFSLGTVYKQNFIADKTIHLESTESPYH
ncbi:UNVERIFIED_CONTAM: hypothetical protein GTU68_028831 [Idotea baltica]|nr:hypothetical protein [Idotea baltica]